MAEEETKEELSTDEAAELEALLEEAGGEEGAAAPGLKGKIQKILSNKKLLMIFGGGALVLLLAIGAGVYFMMGEPEEEGHRQTQRELRSRAARIAHIGSGWRLQPGGRHGGRARTDGLGRQREGLVWQR